MSNYNTLKATINANIKQNGNQEITGQILNSVLNQMVTTLGAGYQFAGVATTATNPGTPDAKVFYIANEKGTYTNFGGLEVTEDEVVVLYYDTEWHKVATGIASQAKLTELVGGESSLTPYQVLNGWYVNADSMKIQDVSSIPSLAYLSLAIFRVEGGKTYKVTMPKSTRFGVVLCYAGDTIAGTICYNKADIENNVAVNSFETINSGIYQYLVLGYDTDSGIPVVITQVNGTLSVLEQKIDAIDADGLKYSKTADIYDIINYGLYVDIIPNKKINTSTGEMEESSTFVTTTLAPLDREHPICLGINGTTSVTSFFDKDKRFISSLTGKYLYNPINVEEFPVNAEYIAFSYNTSFLLADKFFTRRDNLSQYGYQYSKTRKLKGARPVINIYKSDSETAILEKLIDAYLTQDCDVMWEHGEYSFKQVYLDIVDVYNFGKVQGSYQRELPIGGNCHYYFNGSIVTGSLPTGITDAKVFGNMRTDGQPFELHDGKIISDGMVYCVHDEGQAGNLFYSHKYYNMKMTCNSGSRCIGAGTGKHGILVIEGCEFSNSNPSVTDVAVHGVTSSSTDEMDYIVSISNSYFSVGVQVNLLASNQVGELRYCGNSAKNAPIATDGWVLKAWGNEIR